MKFVAKLSDGKFLEIGVREIGEEEAAEADEVVSLAPEERAKRSGGMRRLAALGLVALGAIAISRKVRGSGSGEEQIEIENDESISVEN